MWQVACLLRSAGKADFSGLLWRLYTLWVDYNRKRQKPGDFLCRDVCVFGRGFTRLYMTGTERISRDRRKGKRWVSTNDFFLSHTSLAMRGMVGCMPAVLRIYRSPGIVDLLFRQPNQFTDPRFAMKRFYVLCVMIIFKSTSAACNAHVVKKNSCFKYPLSKKKK